MSSPLLHKAGLERMSRILAGHVDRGDVPGMVWLVSRGDEMHVETVGAVAYGKAAPMRRDAIFRIASITKPVVAAAAMILVEECKIRLDEAVDEWLPELADRRVLRSIESELDDTVAADRPISVRDLLTFRMGFGSIMEEPGKYPIQRAIRELRIGGDGPTRPTDYPPMDEWIKRLGSLPLVAQPGSRWMYHVSADVLGVLIGRVAGMSLGEFLRERIFDPLGMKDTSFQVPAKKAKRLPAFYYRNAETDAVELFDDLEDSAWVMEPNLEAGGGGLCSTVDDFYLFYRMLLHKGRHGREQILSRTSVELMTSDQVPPEHRAGSELFFGQHSSWGFCMSVDTHRDQLYHNPGRFGWTGGYGTTAYVDPKEDFVGILFSQRMMDSPEPPKVFDDFWVGGYGAVS